MSDASQNPFHSEQGRPRLARRVVTLLGGLGFTLAVLSFLAWIQPSSEGERVEKPAFQARFKVERDAPVKPQAPPKDREPPPKPRKKVEKPKPKEIARRSKPRSARPPTASRAPRAPVVGIAASTLGIGGSGGGAVIQVGADDFSDTIDEVESQLAYEELTDTIRESRGTTSEFDAGPRKSPGVAKGARQLPPPKPPYPKLAQQKGIEGAVKFNALVEVDGTISEFEILSAQPKGYFEQTIIESVIPNLRFQPAEDAEGQPLPSWETVIYRFELNDA